MTKENIFQRKYLFIYFDKFFHSFGNAFIDLFGIVTLYINGMSIPLIFLIYGCRFGLMGLLSPLTIILSNKISIAGCTLLANIFRIIGSIMILDSNINGIAILIFIVVMTLPGAITNPISDALSSRYVEQQHRGKFNGMLFVSKILGAGLAATIVSWGILSNNNLLLYITITSAFLIEFICLLPINYKPDVKNKSAFKNFFKFIFKEKSIYKTIYALKSLDIIERLFLPLYIYIAINDFKAFSIILIVSLIVQIIPIILIGIFADKNIGKTITAISVIKSVISALFIFFKNKIFISINKTCADNVEKVYETALNTSLQNIMHKHNYDKTILSTVGQMMLCFAEVVILCLFSFLSIYIGVIIFYVMFALSAIATIIKNILIVREQRKI